ncbi:MAG: penicillin-binding transpeptidase domain-containing protein [Candidatus Colwellbacteria bacterium]|nr:penicillin-binding transpeptidase domain-containing protein [Candidatus Colwellbacteria bacterium]
MRRRKRISDKEVTFDEITVDDLGSKIGPKERPLGSGMFGLVVAIFALMGIAALVRVGFFLVVDGEIYRARADSNVNKVTFIPADRGIIRDRYGEPLVVNEPSLTVYIRVPELVKQREEDAVLSAIAPLGISKDDFNKIISEIDLESADTIVLKRDISNQDAIRIKSLGLSSLFVENDVKRVFSPEFAHIVGYTGLPSKKDLESGKYNSIDIVGKTNLEAFFDSRLKGEYGKVVAYRNFKGEVLEEKTFSDPKAGEDIKTTIDAGLQKYFYDRLGETLIDSGPGGVGLAIDPRNGEVLALVSLPSFASGEIGKGLIDPAKPLFNRAVSGLYSPGSTIKTVVATAALFEKVIKTDEEVLSTGHLDIPNKYNPDQPTRFVDWKAHGWVNVYSALARSSNIFFYAVGGGLPYNMDLFRGSSPISKGLGVNRLHDYYSLFGLDKKTGIELSGENVGYLPTQEDKKKRTGIDWTIGDTYNISIGQGDLTVTPIALLTAVNSIVNGGTLYKPHLVGSSEVLADNTNLSSEMAEVVKGMRDGVQKSYGTSNMLNFLPIKAIGKTGSAQVVSKTKTNAFFIGCAPVPWTDEKPPICILILVENAREGGLKAVPVARDVFQWYYENRLK